MSQTGPASPDSRPVPSFQDIDSETSSDEDESSTQWRAAAEQAARDEYSEDEREAMMYFLKERGLFAFVKHYVEAERIPVPKLLLAFGILLACRPPAIVSLGDQLRVLKMACSKVNREKLDEFNTVDDVVALIAKSKKILVLTGAGVSTSCGIPDFRSPTGLYARLKEEHWELEDPQEMFDLPYFKEKPNVFYSFAKEIYPSNFIPSPCHRFVRLLELNQKLLRNYTQNIDGLFERVGLTRVLNCHGSFATASCLTCRTRFPGSAIEADVFAQRVALCPLCTPEIERREEESREKERAKGGKKGGWKEDDDESEDEAPGGEWRGKALVKPDIVFFGEMLSDEFDRRLLEDREEVDLLIVIGTSLRVSPVAQIVSHLPHSVPQILINRDPISHANFDVHLLGDGDTIVKYLCERLEAAASPAPPRASGWDLDERVPALGPPPIKEPVFDEGGTQVETEKPAEVVPERVAGSHVWLFPGANGGRWVEAVRRVFEDSDEDDGTSEEGDVGSGLEVPSAGEKSRSRTRSPDSEREEGKKPRFE